MSTPTDYVILIFEVVSDILKILKLHLHIPYAMVVYVRLELAI